MAVYCWYCVLLIVLAASSSDGGGGSIINTELSVQIVCCVAFTFKYHGCRQKFSLRDLPSRIHSVCHFPRMSNL
jgi:hypothetical protein